MEWTKKPHGYRPSLHGLGRVIRTLQVLSRKTDWGGGHIKAGVPHHDHKLSSRIVVLNHRLRMSASSCEGKCTLYIEPPYPLKLRPELSPNHRPFPLPQFPLSPSPLPTTPNSVSPPSTNQTDPSSLPHGQPLPPTLTRDVRSIGQTTPTEVQTPWGSSCGEARSSLEGVRGSTITTREEGKSSHINAPPTPSTSDAGAQHISEKCGGQPYDTSNTHPPLFAHDLCSPCESPHIPPNTEEIRAQARIAKREVQIDALEAKIGALKATFEAESREKYAAIVDHFNNRILTIQKEITDRFNEVLSRPPENRRPDREGEEFAPPCPELRSLSIRYSH